MEGAHQSPTLLPQPQVGAAIEAMRGGGTTTSLLEQPPFRADITPYRGGGSAAAAPPPPAAGATERYPILSLEKWSPVKISADMKEKELLAVENFRAYKEIRQLIWGDDPAKLPKTIDESNKIKLVHTLPEKSKVKIFHFYDLNNLMQHIRVIQRDSADPKNKYIYILFSKITNLAVFSLALKKYIELFSTLTREVYFLYTRNSRINQISWDSGGRETAVSKEFLYLEPTYVVLPYTEKGVKKFFILGDKNKFPDPPVDPDKKNLIGLSPRITDTETFSFSIKPDGTFTKKYVTVLGGGNIYHIEPPSGVPPEKEFLRDKFITITYTEEEPPEKVEEEEEEEEKEEEKKEEKEEEKKEEKEEKEKEKPLPPYILKLADDIPVSLGMQTFKLRKPTTEIQKEWMSSKFTESELDFFAHLGITSEFSSDPNPRKVKLVEDRGKFLLYFTVHKCLDNPNVMFRYECEFIHNYINELYEILHIDKIKRFTKQFTDVTQAAVQVKKVIQADMDESVDMKYYTSQLVLWEKKSTKQEFAYLLNRIRPIYAIDPITNPAAIPINTSGQGLTGMLSRLRGTAPPPLPPVAPGLVDISRSGSGYRLQVAI